MRVLLSQRAGSDAVAHWEYILRFSARAADRFEVELFREIARLELFPHIGKPGRASGTRELTVGKTGFMLIYAVRDKHIDVLRIMHSKQDWPSRFNRSQ